MADESQKRIGSHSWNKIAAILVIVALVLFTVYILVSLNSWVAENNSLQQPRTYHAVFGYNYNQISPIDPRFASDIELDLTIHYPRSTLVVDDRVSIDGLAVINTYPENLTIKSITLGFENSLSYPVVQTDGITNSSNMFLHSIDGTNRFAGTVNCTWAIEGTYHMQMVYLMENATGQYRSPYAQSPNMAITVYPRAELAQIVTNNASMVLTVAFYGLTVVGTFSFVLSLWDRKQSTQNGKNNDNNNANRTAIKKSKSKDMKAKTE